MKVIHVISSIDRLTGGPSNSVTQLIGAILNHNESIKIVLKTRITKNPIIKEFKKVNGKLDFHKFSNFRIINLFRKSYNLEIANIYHGHGLWLQEVHQMSNQAQKRNIPYIITPRGMLEPWALEQGKLKKQIAMKLFQYKDLVKSTCIHATSTMEVESIRKLGFKNPVALIPNGIDLKEFPKEKVVNKSNQKKILFLSRIHPKKGIENLIEAWSQLNESIRNNWIIEIVGNGEEEYIKTLNKTIQSKHLNQQIIIKPPVFGSDKFKKFQEASFFVLPTYSENFGIVVAEALASYTPVITTKGAPWEDLQKYNCGWWIEIGVQPLKEALEKAMQTKESDLLKMGQNGRKLVAEKFSIDSVAKKMIALYNWILSTGEKPNFIYE